MEEQQKVVEEKKKLFHREEISIGDKKTRD